jgi:hypothetical protein
MDGWLRQSTAVDLSLGPFLDSADGFTARTALSITNVDVLLRKQGINGMNAKTDLGSATHESLGHYRIPLNSTDTNTLGWLKVVCNKAGALPVWQNYEVLPTTIYDALVNFTSTLPANVTAISNDAAAADALEADYDGTGFAKVNSVIGHLTNLSATAQGQVKAQVDLAVKADIASALTGVPPDLDSLMGMVRTLYMIALMGLDVTSNEITFKDASNAALWKKTITDLSEIYTEAKVSAP